MAGNLMSWFKSHTIISYFLLVFIIGWLFWLPLIASEEGFIGVQLPRQFLFYAAGVAPIASATLLELATRGRRGLRQLYGRFTIRSSPIRWYFVSVVLPVSIALSAFGIQLLIDGQVTIPLTVSLLLLLIGRGLLLAPAAAFEEVGWRGFALPRLQSRFNSTNSSLILGPLWALWHLPLWWLQTGHYAQMNPLWWTGDVIAVAIILTWLFNNGKGNLWLPCLFHGMANNAFEALQVYETLARPLLMVLVALAVVIVYGPRNLSRSSLPPSAYVN